MKSGKQRRAEIKAARLARAATAKARLRCEPRFAVGSSSALCERELLARYNSYGDPEFVCSGRYFDKPFRCRDCGAACIWTAKQQKWWYEKAKGSIYSTAVRCSACRANKRAQREASRPASIEARPR